MQLSPLAGHVRTRDRDRFYAALFVPEPARESLLALAALNIELKHVHSMVSEEMIGHIRYAWWQEAIEGLYAGQPPRGHPVLEALAPVIAAGHLPPHTLMPLVERYREHFPLLPPDVEVVMENISLELLCSICTGADKGWRKANGIITRHRQRYGRRLTGWLAFRLLLAGVF